MKKDWQENFLTTIKNFSRPIFSTSFSAEDQIIFDFIAENNLPVEVFAIDSGRLPEEVLELWQETVKKYQIEIQAFYPNQDELAKFVTQNGINSFYDSQFLRKSCCEIRKVEPLKRALFEKDLWISGVRKSHSKARQDKDVLEFDEDLNLTKFYPIIELSDDEMWEIIERKQIPSNSLYQKGYKSIGCAPCSRAVLPHEDARAGRWWWESDEKKECGLHALRNKKLH